jgi:hypothetical protein
VTAATSKPVVVAAYSTSTEELESAATRELFRHLSLIATVFAGIGPQQQLRSKTLCERDCHKSQEDARKNILDEPGAAFCRMQIAIPIQTIP